MGEEPIERVKSAIQVLNFFLRSTVLVLSIPASAVFSISSVVNFCHILYELTELPVLNTHFNLSFLIIMIICSVVTVMLLISFMAQGLHFEGLLEDTSTLSEGVYLIGNFNNDVKLSRFGE